MADVAREAPQEIYLGDGLYALTSSYDVKLRAPRAGLDHWVALDPGMMAMLVTYLRQNGWPDAVFK